MKSTIIPFLAALSLLSTVTNPLSTCRAQGTSFTYQGRLNNSASLADGTFDLRFALYDASTSGTQIGLLTNSSTAISNGLFTVILDFGAQFSTGLDRWIEIAVRSNTISAFTTLAPRQKIAPTPYAIFAGGINASNITGQLPPSNLTGTWQTNGNTGANGAFLGTTDNQPFEIRVNNQRAMQVLPASDTPNILGGYSGNSVSNGYVGTFIGGGGTSLAPQIIGNNFAAIIGGQDNLASGFASLASGQSCTANGDYSAAIGYSAHAVATYSHAIGTSVVANGLYATAIGSGVFASGNESTAIGDSTTSSGVASTAMGFFSVSSGAFSTATGNTTTASGLNSTAMGINTVASGTNSTALGSYAAAAHLGTFVYADASSTTPFASSAPNQFLIRAVHGVGIGKTNPASALDVAGVVTATSFNPTSDRNAKENFSDINPVSILEKVINLKITRWNFKTDSEAPHVGPMAQDFRAAFNLGTDDKHIATVDADGVAFAAIQGLNQKIEAQKAENAELKQQLAEIKQMLAKLSAGKN